MFNKYIRVLQIFMVGEGNMNKYGKNKMLGQRSEGVDKEGKNFCLVGREERVVMEILKNE